MSYTKDLRWITKSFTELTSNELYQLLKLRSEVFVVEQNCAFQDLDFKDQPSFHFCGWKQEQLVAYTRLLPPGIAYENCSIGRVVTSPSVRRQGVGRLLMQASILKCQELFHSDSIEIGAQLYLENFYESFQFKREGAIYLEDGIEHIHMRRSLF